MNDAATIADEPTADWDELAVDRPGGHVLQSVAWARHREASGWRPRFLSWRAHRVLALVRPWPVVGGGSAYVPRGPVPTAGGRETGVTAWTIAAALRAHGVDVVAIDPEVPAEDDAYREVLDKARFRPIEEIQPSRHKVSLPLAGADEDAVFHGIAKATRQRIRKAEGQGICVVRFDARAGDADGDVDADAAGDGFARPGAAAAPALDRFYDLLLETGERKHFTFGPRASFVGWWERGLAAGHIVYLEARAGRPDGDVLGGLLLYRHGDRLSTVHSGDPAASRRDHPGTMHLLRWRAIQLAIREGRREMDLGGVDVPGARRRPVDDEPMHGLLQHKLSFGAEWLELAGAQERVHRPLRYGAGRAIGALARRIGR
jgi:lipid II:glycine glycyltransferase (peptidoglycan interpeptide bridge formation enzyme)